MKPTLIRYRMVLLAMMIAVLLYLDRICLSTASQYVRRDLALTDWQLEWVLSAFFWTYALGQLPAGWLGDRFGARWMLGLYAVLWSISTGVMGWAGGFVSLLIMRFACGLFESGAYPVAASIVQRWIPAEHRGLASAVIAVGGRLGGSLAPIITVQLMLVASFGMYAIDWPEQPIASDASWRPVMIFYGVLGVAIAGVFVWLFRDWPEHHPGVNAAERELIEGSVGLPRIETQSRQHIPGPPLMAMCRHRGLWMTCLVQFAANLGWAFLATSLPTYLTEVHHTSHASQGWMQSLSLLAGVFGLLIGGRLTDLAARYWGPRWGRAATMIASRLAVAVAFVGCLFVQDSLQVAACLILVGFSTDLGTAACWAFGQDIGGRHVGAVVGWANMWGNFGAALSPILLGSVVRSFGDNVALGWQVAFLACAGVQVLAAIAAFYISGKSTVSS